MPGDLRLDVPTSWSLPLLNGLLTSLEEPQMLAVIPPLKLIGVGLSLRTTVLPSLEERIEEITDDADLDEEPDSRFAKTSRPT